MRIFKFGGKSLSSVEKVQKIAKYIKKIYKNDKKIIIIVSAMGSRTNELIDIANKITSKKIEKSSLDSLISLGENESCAILSLALNKIHVKAKSLSPYDIDLKTFGEHGDGLINSINKTCLEKFLSKDMVIIIPGFQGINEDNEITTLGRNGSDITASAIGAVFNHDVEIYSDYDGVFSGDPKSLKFKKINNLSYDSMKELGLSGAKVISPRATEIAKDFNFKIISKSSTSPTSKGTVISQIEKNFISFSSQDFLCNLSISFSHNNFQKTVKNVVFLQKKYKIYKITIKSNKISLLINESDKDEIILFLSKNLKLINT